MASVASKITPLIERREKPRMQCNYPAVVQNHDGSEMKFQESGRATNLSRSGIFILLNHEVPKGTDLVVKISFPTDVLRFGTPRLSLQGTVVRIVPQSENLFGIGVRIEDFRFV